MSGKNTAVFGIYHTRDAAEEAVDALRRAHFRNTDISALFPDNAGSKDFAHEKNTKAPEGATTGAASGAVAGGVLGWLAGVGVLAIPGIGPFIAAGPIMAALAGAGAGVDAAKQGWSDAQSARTSGNVEDAVAKGKAAQAKLSEVMASLGMDSKTAAAK